MSTSKPKGGKYSNQPKKEEVQNSSGYKKCQQATADGNYGKFSAALSEVTDIGEVDGNKNTLLHWVVCYKRVEWVDDLVKKGANFSLKNAQNLTPLELAEQAINVANDSSYIDIKNSIKKITESK